MLVAALLGASPCRAQEQLTVQLQPINIENPADSALADSLLRYVRDGLNVRSRPRFAAELPGDAPGATRRAPYARVQLGLSRAGEQRHRVLGVVFDSAGKQRDVFDVYRPVDETSQLFRETLDRLAFGLSASIRIAIREFRRTGGDSARYHGLQRSLSNMLVGKFGSAAHLALIDLANADLIAQLRNAGGTTAGRATGAPDFEQGLLLNANYLLVGEFLVLDEQLRLDVRCVSLVTGEIVASEGAVVQVTSLSDVERELTRIAADIRTAVESDFWPSVSSYAIAVGAVPPSPPTFRNRKVHEAVLRALRDKLMAIDSRLLMVRDDGALDEDMLRRRMDPWQVASRLQARYLVQVGMRRADPDRFRVSAELYDIGNLATPASVPVELSIDDVDAGLDSLLARLIDPLVPGDSGAVNRMRAARYQHPYPLLEVSLGLGAVRWNDQALFLSASGAPALEAALAYRAWEPVQLRATLRFEPFASGGGGRQAYGAHVLLGTSYFPHPRRSRGPFVSALSGVAGVLRRSETSRGYNAAVAYGANVGYQLYWSRQVPWTVRMEWFSTLAPIRGQTIGGTFFPGGRPGGFYILFNTAL